MRKIGDDLDQERCPVCLGYEGMQEGYPILDYRMKPCGHKICRRCFLLLENDYCPTCRAMFTLNTKRGFLNQSEVDILHTDGRPFSRGGYNFFGSNGEEGSISIDDIRRGYQEELIQDLRVAGFGEWVDAVIELIESENEYILQKNFPNYQKIIISEDYDIELIVDEYGLPIHCANNNNPIKNLRIGGSHYYLSNNMCRTNFLVDQIEIVEFEKIRDYVIKMKKAFDEKKKVAMVEKMKKIHDSMEGADYEKALDLMTNLVLEIIPKEDDTPAFTTQARTVIPIRARWH